EVPADYTRARMRCPECGVMCDVPPPEARKPAPKRSAPRRAPSPEPAPTPPVEPSPPAMELPIPLAPEAPPSSLPPLEEDFGTDEDDGKPYRVAGPKGRKCPDCGAFTRPAERQCPPCAF